jgi:hypothetical protein
MDMPKTSLRSGSGMNWDEKLAGVSGRETPAGNATPSADC